MIRLDRVLKTMVLASSFVLAVVAPVAAQAPAEAPAEGEAASGEPLYGYVGVAALSVLPLFILCKSARR